jgi:hypothetical protein
MNPISKGVHPPRRFSATLSRALVVAGFLLGINAFAFIPSSFFGTNANPNYVQLESWSFNDSMNWTDDDDYDPLSFTNLYSSNLGNGHSLAVGTNIPAWLQYNVVESDGTTNLTVDQGTVTFWFAPSWSGTNMGGDGPGEFGRLLEIGGYTPDSSFGWWSIYVDDVGCNLYFSAQTNDLSSSVTTYLTTPISWTTNYFHCVALTYSATNTALYIDGVLATNGPGMTVYPGSDVLANGFFIGSDSNGVYQANGLFNNITTYNTPLDASTIARLFQWGFLLYPIDPLNKAMFALSSGNYTPSVTATPNVITGQGNLQSVGAASVCVSGANPNQVWITNVTASAAANGTMNVTFAIEGGQDGYYYDVFAGTVLTSPFGNGFWSWQGQGQHCQMYMVTNLPQGTIFLMLGTPQDSDGDGLTDAYELLVSHTDPNNAYSNLDGILDGWEVLLGLNPQTANFNSASQRANYGYTTADWLNGVSGIRSGTISTDNEGNVQSVSQ